MGCVESAPEPAVTYGSAITPATAQRSQVAYASAPAPQVSYAPPAPAIAQDDDSALVGSGEGKEPMLLLDTTGSMTCATSKTDPTPRWQTVREAIGVLVEKLGAHDSEAGEPDDEGGLRTVTFAKKTAVDIEDLNPGNVKAKFSKIDWDGSTWIMPGWRMIKKVYAEEFGKREAKDRPQLAALVITDGEAEDYKEFADALRATKTQNVFVCVAIIGYGDDHDRTLKSYQAIADENKHIKVISFDSESDPNKIAGELLKLIE